MTFEVVKENSFISFSIRYTHLSNVGQTTSLTALGCKVQGTSYVGPHISIYSIFVCLMPAIEYLYLCERIFLPAVYICLFYFLKL